MNLCFYITNLYFNHNQNLNEELEDKKIYLKFLGSASRLGFWTFLRTNSIPKTEISLSLFLSFGSAPKVRLNLENELLIKFTNKTQWIHLYLFIGEPIYF